MTEQIGNPVGTPFSKSEYRSWFERLEVVFIDLDIDGVIDPTAEEPQKSEQEKKDKARVVKLIRWIGAKGYEKLKQLCAPEKPIDKKYDDLKKLLLDNVDPEPTVLSQRFSFSRLKQENLSVSDWEALLKSHAAKCAFGTFYQDAVRDQFVFGLSCNETQIKLMEQPDCTLQQAFAAASARERAERDNKLFGGTTDPVGGKKPVEVNKLYHGKPSKTNSNTKGNESSASRGRQPSGGSSSSGKSGGSTNASSGNKVCKRCKLKLTTNKCTYSRCNTKCFVCQKLGHTKSQCFKVKNTHQLEDNVFGSSSVEDKTQVLNYIDVNKVSCSSDKVFVNMTIESKSVKLELDTGSALTCISESLFNHLFSISGLKLRPARQVLKVANGSTIDRVQVCDVDISYNGSRHHQVKLYVASDPFPALLGRDWLSLIWGTDWASKLLTREDTFCEVTTEKSDVADGYVYRLDQEVLTQSSVEKSVNDRESRLAKMQQSKVFETGIGEVVGYEAQLQLKDDHKPVFRKARTVPYALKEKIEETLDKMVEDKILTPVEHSQFASPIVPVLKPDSTVRICGDYKSTLNPQLETKQYPLPCVDECFHPMRGGQQFSKLDIRQAYNHLPLREEDKKLTTINTPKGLYVWNRLPYGISSATAIFQQTMDNVLQGCKGTVCRVDDILVTGKTEEEHLDNLEEVIRRLEKAQFRCNLMKSQFLRDEVQYLGYLITKQGIRPSTDKVETLVKAKYPESLPALVSFLSACQYYGRFIKNLSTIVEPLNQLRRGVPWKFGETERKAFDTLKEALTSSAVIVPYDPRLPVKIDTDASATGIGAVISHVMEDGTERPIEYASRTLSKSERNYSQIEKEALSLVWGVGKFHKFVYARNFTLVTDHKPLLYILKENKAIPDMAASRIVRWAHKLACYQYKIQYRPTEKHSNADVCSRYPLQAEEEEEDTEVADVFFNTFAEKTIINFATVGKFTPLDVTLSKVKKFVLEGWPEKLGEDQKDLKPYFEKRDELSCERGCVLWGTRIVVPQKLRQDVLELLHTAHQGVVAVKALARSYVWWPRINDEIEEATKACKACQDSRNLPAKSKPHPWKPAKKPWERIHADFCGPVNGDMYLIVVDAYSKWIEAINMKSSTTSPSTIRELRKLFATHGLPVMFCSDNGPQLKSEEIRQFLRSNGIQAVPVPTYSPNTNGIAERAVQTFKKAMEKASRTSKDYEKNLARWLLLYRNTPNSVTNQTPAMMMFNRPTRTLLSLLDPLTNNEDNLQTNLYEEGGKDKVRSFDIGDQVRIRNIRTGQWYRGSVIKKEGCKVYWIKSQFGVVERRHVDHIVRATDLRDDSELEITRDMIDTRVPWHKPIACYSREPDQAVPTNNSRSSASSSSKSNEIPQPVPVIMSKELIAKHPVIEITRSKPTSLTSDTTRVVSPDLAVSARPDRVSSRLRSQVSKLNYSKLGGT